MSRSSLRPLRSADWNEAAARHLLNRAGFGVPESSLAYLVQADPADAVAAFVDYEQFDDNGTPADFLVTPAAYREYRDQLADVSREQPQRREQVIRRFLQTERTAIARLKWWWFERMYHTSRPLQEKMALFWHGHFATSTERVRASYPNWQLNEIFRHHATGNFKELTTRVGQSAAMLTYLDNRLNRRNAPNENWARELLELFTIGIGQYTERDIREAARAFTGWTFHPETFEFVFDMRQHDYGAKEFLGRRGLFDGDDILEIIFDQDAVAAFICGKLWQFFVHEEIDQRAVDDMARQFREANYELKPVLRTLFASQAFYDASHRNERIKSPVEFTIQLLDDLRIDMGEVRRDERAKRNILLVLRALGQDLLTPPNVKGWEGNRAWINSQTLLVRYNVAGMLINGQVQLPAPNPDLEDSLSEIEELRREAELMRRVDAPFRPRLYFEDWDGLPAGEVIDALAARLLERSLSPEQRRILLDALGEGLDEATPLQSRSLSEARLRGVVHLMTSLVEYQLC